MFLKDNEGSGDLVSDSPTAKWCNTDSCSLVLVLCHCHLCSNLDFMFQVLILVMEMSFDAVRC